MNQEEADIELIERKLKGELSDEELKQFDSRITTDLEFAEKVDDYSEIIFGVKCSDIQGISNDVAQWEKEIRAAEGGPKIIPLLTPWMKRLLVAASVTLLFVTSLYFFRSQQPQSPDHLFTSYFTPYEDVISVRDEITTDESLGYAMKYYGEEKYAEAIPYFQSYLSSHENNPDAQFYLGIAYLAEKNTSDGIKIFNQLIAQHTAYQDMATWYLALANVLEGNTTQAKDQLRQIAEDDQHNMQHKAMEVLDDLD